MRRSNYDKFPIVHVPGYEDACVAGWRAIGARLRDAKTVVVETYPGVLDDELLPALREQFRPEVVIHSRDSFKSPDEIDRMIADDLTDDPVFGKLTALEVKDFLKAGPVIDRSKRTLVYGVGASLLVDQPDVLVYADLARWEIQMRQRRNEISNLGAENRNASPSQKYKRAFFVDWRVADRLKRQLFDRVDFFLDTNTPNQPKLTSGHAIRAGLRHAATRPFRVMPFFDPGPWGGQWMKQVCNLDCSVQNFAWCFDCVPEENSLLLGFGEHRIELPSIDLVFQHPRELLGEKIFNRFGAEFPIRFDFLDTMGGGNLSLQVHPLPEYIRENFRMPYTQDESYYLLDAERDATVYLGFKPGVKPDEFVDSLRTAQSGGSHVDVEKFVNKFAAKKHDHFLIPAGTIHCSGKNSTVLEISATPYIFTFKLWDWGRMGLDGKPRPIHIDHGKRVLQYDRATDWVKTNLINRFEPLARGDGWREERTGLHELEFIETRRHWFSKTVPHDTGGNLNVLNLVQGEEAIIESPTGAFEPFVVHYAETFIIPAVVGAYTIRPHGQSIGHECATIKAFVR
ncbi:MAG: class I mannose-6-phosphate isomerase [Anaerolineae bacterium]|nr:class I mannose-6-phosphate isomerase [Phycisphaerae bacterium]